jgi:hypothetical protein
VTAASFVGELEETGDALLGHFVERCREQGLPWSQISAALGVSRQAVHKRFAPSSVLSRLTAEAANQADRAEVDLDRAFESACVTALGEVRRLGFMPGGWIGLIDQVGATQAARQLLGREPSLPVFHFLVGIGRPELSVEGMVVQTRWKPLFSDLERDTARGRLRRAGVEQF